MQTSLFCIRCGSSTPFAGLADDRRRVQSVRCPSCATAVRRGEAKWISADGEARHCPSCGSACPACSRYARCGQCRTQDRAIPPAPYAISSAPRVCDICSNALAQYEQSRRICQRCRRRQVSERPTDNAPLATSVETPAPIPIQAPSSLFRPIAPSPKPSPIQAPYSPFRPILPSPRPRPPATPTTPGRQTFPSPQTGTPETPVPPPALPC